MTASRIYEWARSRPDKTAIIHNDTPLSYAAFARAIAATHMFLAQHDLAAGRTAIVLATDLLEGWFIVLALQALGLNTISVGSLDQAAALRVNDCACVAIAHADQLARPVGSYAWPGAQVIVIPSSLYGDIRSGGAPPTPEDSHPVGGHFLYTSGTTGSYKKVLREGATEEKRHSMMARVRGYSADTRYNSAALGLWTSAGTLQPGTVWHVGGCVVIDQRPDFLTNFFRHRITHAFLLPDDIAQILKFRNASDPRVPGLEILTGGGFLPLSSAEGVVRRLASGLAIGYGSTECAFVMGSRFETKDDLLWLTPDAGRTVQIVDESGGECAFGQEGELRILPTEIDSKSYVDDEEASARVFRNGFFYPGDLAVRRPDGRIRILGRIADVLNVQGQKVPVAPLEQKIQQRLHVNEVCLFSGLNNDGRDVLVIAIESARELPKADLDAIALEFPFFERVRFSILEEFPRTTTGLRKTRRSALRQIVFSTAE